MSDRLHPNDPVSAILHLPGEALDLLLSEEPFLPVDGFITLRTALGVATLCELPMLADRDTAKRIAFNAAVDAQPDGLRLLAVAWRGGVAGSAWIEGVNGRLNRATLILPVERMFTALAARLVDYRNARTRLN